MLEGLVGLATGLVDKVVGVVPAQKALLGVLQLLGGKFIKQSTTESTPNEIILVWSVAISMFGNMLIYSGAHPEWPLQALAEASLWPSMQQFVVVTGIHSAVKNGGKLAKIGTAALEVAVNALPGGTVVGSVLKFLKLKK